MNTPTKKSTAVVALGGNALLRRGDAPSFTNQLANIKIAAKAIAEIAKEYQVAIVHGNGPQVGLLALQNLPTTRSNHTRSMFWALKVKA